MSIEKILRDLRDGRIGVEEAMKELKHLPYRDIGFAKIDFHRRIRRGIPEAIYAPGKSVEQIRKIVREMKGKEKIFITKAGKDVYEGLKEIEDCRFYRDARMIVIGKVGEKIEGDYICVLSGGTSDMAIAEEASVTAEELGNEVRRIYDVGSAGVHRLLDYVEEIEEAGVVIVVAGMDGILPTVASNFTSSPIIAVPTSVGYGTGLGGVAALMSMLNTCSPGIAVVNIDNGFGAGVIAHLIMGRRRR